MDFGFIRYKSLRQKIFIKLCSTIVYVSITIICITLLTFEKPEKTFIYWFARSVIENYAQIIILMFTSKSKSFYSFLQNMHLIDSRISVDPDSDRIHLKIIIMCAVIIFMRISSSFIYVMLFNSKYCTQDFIFLLSHLSTDFSVIILYFLFNAVHSRLIVLRNCITNDSFKIKHIRNLYKLLIDSKEIAKDAFDHLVSFILII